MRVEAGTGSLAQSEFIRFPQGQRLARGGTGVPGQAFRGQGERMDSPLLEMQMLQRREEVGVKLATQGHSPRLQQGRFQALQG